MSSSLPVPSFVRFGTHRLGTGSQKLNPLAGFPVLIGASKKSFLGKIIQSKTGRETEARERGWATAASVACAVQQHALVVRVHDVKQMRDVIGVAEALWS